VGDHRPCFRPVDRSEAEREPAIGRSPRWRFRVPNPSRTSPPSGRMGAGRRKRPPAGDWTGRRTVRMDQRNRTSEVYGAPALRGSRVELFGAITVVDSAPRAREGAEAFARSLSPWTAGSPLRLTAYKSGKGRFVARSLLGRRPETDLLTNA
jgi:hypothetical protein